MKIAAFNGAAISLYCSPNSVVKNNYLYNTNYVGIGDWSDPTSCTGGMDNTLVSGNIITNSCAWGSNYSSTWNDQDGGDCAAIYIDTNNDNNSTKIQVINNYIRDVDLPDQGAGDWKGGDAEGILIFLIPEPAT